MDLRRFLINQNLSLSTSEYYYWLLMGRVKHARFLKSHNHCLPKVSRFNWNWRVFFSNLFFPPSRFRPSSDAVLHMSRIECKWAKSFVLPHLHSIRLMWSTASELALSLLFSGSSLPCLPHFAPPASRKKRAAKKILFALSVIGGGERNETLQTLLSGLKT